MCILCDPGKPQFHSTSRRNFLKGTAATGLAAGAMTLFLPSAEAQGHNVNPPPHTGDCVTAEEAFAKACHSPEIFIPDSLVMQWASRHGVLEGANLHQVLQWMQTDGFRQTGHTYDDGPFYSVDWTNAGALTSAISQGPVKIGIAADQVEPVWRQNNGRTGWFATGFHHDANEDHCVSLCGYGTIMWLAQELNVKVPPSIDGTRPGYAMFTWDSIGIIDQPSMVAITHEAWLRTPTTIVK